MLDRVKLIQEIEKLAINNPVLYASIQEYRSGSCTWEEAMMIAIKVLVIQKNVMEKELIRMKDLSISPIIFGIDFGKGESQTVITSFKKNKNGITILDQTKL